MNFSEGDFSVEDPSDSYTLITPFLFTGFFVFTLLTNIPVLCVIIFVPKTDVKLSRWLLSVPCIQSLVASFLSFIIQPRIVSGRDEHIPIMSYGHCHYLNSEFCFILYMVWQILSIFIVLQKTIFHNWSKKYDNSSDEEYMLIWKMIPKEVPNIINFAMVIYGTFIIPIVGLVMAGQIIQKLKNSPCNSLRVSMMKIVIASVVQNILHLVFNSLFYSVYAFSIYAREEYLFQQYFLPLAVNISTWIHPIVIIYVFRAYRRTLLSFIRDCVRRKRTIPIMVTGPVSRSTLVVNRPTLPPNN